jgi:hypothetical protein
MKPLHLIRPRWPMWLLSLSLLLAVAGCATARDPVVGDERVLAAPVPLGNVLVVVDIRGDVQASGAGQKDTARLERLYAPLGQAMSDAVAAAGGKPRLVVVSFADDLPRPGAQDSHVWTQTITRLTRHSGSYGNYTDNRSWISTIAHRKPGTELLQPAYQTRYTSDGVACFGTSHQYYANRAECQRKYLALIKDQLQNYLKNTTSISNRVPDESPAELVVCVPPGSKPGDRVRLPQWGTVTVKAIATVNTQCGTNGSPGGLGSLTATVLVPSTAQRKP